MKTQRAHRYRAWVSIGFVVIACGAFGTGMFYMMRQQRLIDEHMDLLAREAGREQSMQGVVSLLEDVREEQEAIATFFISPDNAVGFIELLEGLSDVVGTPVSINNVRVEGADEATGEGVLVVDVAARGSWRSVYHTLTVLTTLPVASTIRSVSLVRSDAGDEGSVWALRATVEALLRN